MRSYYVYMLFCSDGTFYVGVTNNVDRRVAEHERGDDRFCYTYKRRPVKLVYSTAFEFIHDAIDWEKRLKGWTHRKKRALAEGKWDDVKRYPHTRLS